ncbi:MAG: ethanolamine utilization microcompartment protein EutL [Bilophila wadsworthia]
MKVLQPVPVRVLASRIIPSVDPGLAAAFKLEPRHRALALFTSDSDDVSYIAIDEATKKAAVDVVYASSFYGGAAHASGPYSGEFIGILAAETPGDVEEGLRIAVDHAQNRVSFLTADPEGKLIFLSHLVSSCGTYVAEQAGIPVGTALAWLIAPPLEATFGLDAALKAADVRLVKHFPPPSETHFPAAGLPGIRRRRRRVSVHRCWRCRQSIGKNLILRLGGQEPLKRVPALPNTLPPKTFDWWGGCAAGVPLFT